MVPYNYQHIRYIRVPQTFLTFTSHIQILRNSLYGSHPIVFITKRTTHM
jgi:hypothetical protein